ncbi:MAG TPA: phytanoyl-CoA dioxygenase family protein [Caulobacteraceae bacterium]|nr:phytanoyl-CoA dioxygenase family protein [Caulobacteraceae bacterium]
MSATFALTAEQRAAFDRGGVLRLPGFYPLADIEEMAAALWSDLGRRFGACRDQPETWKVVSPAQFQALKGSGAFKALGSPELFDLADALLGKGTWDAPRVWGFPLVTFPTAAPTLTRPPWHLDIGGEALSPLPILRVFTFLEPAPANGGGTLMVAGSHLLAIDIERAHGTPVRSAYVRDRLKADHPYFARLLSRRSEELRKLMEVEAEAGGHFVRLEEMTGAPGDVIVMHPAILHGTAHNALGRPRMMLTEWIRRKVAAEAAAGAEAAKLPLTPAKAGA